MPMYSFLQLFIEVRSIKLMVMLAENVSSQLYVKVPQGVL